MIFSGNGRVAPLTTMADGTLKQVNPFSGTQVWTVPGRGNRPLNVPTPEPTALTSEDFTHACAFCSGRSLDTPPEKSRVVPDSSQPDGWRIDHHLLPHEQQETQDTFAFRRVPNLFEIVSYSSWLHNYGYQADADIVRHYERYVADPTGLEHIDTIVATRVAASGADAEDISANEREQLRMSYFAGGHDLIIGRRHFVDDASDSTQLMSSGLLSPAEHYAMMKLTVDSIRDLYTRNRYVRYVVAFQNWLRPAGASFDHLHKQLVAIDERGRQADQEIAQLRHNPNMYNELAVDYAGYHNLTIAENEHAVLIAGVGHRYPTLELYSKSDNVFPWEHTPNELRAMSDLLHAAHAATGAEVPCNEEWHQQPIDLDIPMPWRINIKWRVSNLAGFEGGTKIYINTLSPMDVRDRVVDALYRLRDEGKVTRTINIATECSTDRNMLRYNPVLQTADKTQPRLL